MTQDASGCTNLLPGASCVLSFTSTTPYVAQGNILITADNITSPPTTALAFSLDGYLVFAIPSASTALVVDSSDASSSFGIAWSTTFDNILGINETSTAPPCNGGTDGACDSDQIVTYYNSLSVPITDYAAGLCYAITSDNSGSVPLGTWYLPAICQINSDPGTSESGCSISTPSINTNLYTLGFLPELSAGGSGDSPGNYWSSTECSGSSDANCNNQPESYAWAQNFGGDNNSFTVPKDFSLGARCVRVISY